ncbi:hypothetical protein CBR14_22855, partial [Cronobacter sakazakii]
VMATAPLRRVHLRARVEQEVDLGPARARNPSLILMDGRAHSNAPGSRHPKRWQDVDELLDEWIDVITTVKVQHMESLS